MSGGEIAALVAAIAFVVLVAVLAVPILKLRRTVDETTKLVANMNDRAVPLLSDLNVTLNQVNGQLQRVDTITRSAQTATTNVAAVTSLFAATLGGPMVRVAALSYGVRKAVQGRRRRDSERRVSQELRAERRRARLTRRGR